MLTSKVMRRLAFDRTVGSFFNSYDSGLQINTSGVGTQNNNTGSSNQLHSSFSGPVYFGRQPAASRDN
jgi:hypothetical protein